MLKKFDLYRFTALTDDEKNKINNKKTVKSRSQSVSVLPAGQKTNRTGERVTVPADIDQLSQAARHLFNDEHLEVSKVRPFFWSLVETYVDRFQAYPFDAKKALFCSLELEAEAGEDSEQALRELILQLEALYKKNYGKELSAPAAVTVGSTLDEDVKQLRSCLKYAALVSDTLVSDN